MSTQSDPTQKRSRRKRKTMLLMARKYGKKGCYGRGSEIDSDTYNYFVRILEVYRNGFDSEDDKSIFVNNVFEQIKDQEITYSSNQIGCRVIEMLLPFATDTVLDRFMTKFGEDLRPLCNDRFASHVIQTIVKQCYKKSLGGDDNKSTEFQEKCKNFVLKVGRFLLNNLEDYIWDTYANHVIRSCLECMSQLSTDNPNENTVDRIKKDPTIIIPSEYEDVIKEYAQRILPWPQFDELCNTTITSGFLQVLLKALKQTDKKLLTNYLRKLLNEHFIKEQEIDDPNLLPPAFLSKPLISLLETSIQVAKRKMFTQIYLKCFLNRLPKLATMQSTNFAVRKLITCCEEKTEFEAIFEELKDSFTQIIDAGLNGILLALGQGCKKFSTKQGIFVQNLMSSLNCLEPDERQNSFIICLITFRNYDTIQDSTNLSDKKLNLNGTLILQLLLEFNKPIKIVNGLLNLDSTTLEDLFCQCMGCHIVKSFVSSSFVGEKSREKLIKKLEGHYQVLASNKYGSRAFDDIWDVANLKNKLLIMDELANKDGIWSNTLFGRIIASKINLVLYKRDKEAWKNSLNLGSKAKKLFEGIVE